MVKSSAIVVAPELPKASRRQFEFVRDIKSPNQVLEIINRSHNALNSGINRDTVLMAARLQIAELEDATVANIIVINAFANFESIAA